MHLESVVCLLNAEAKKALSTSVLHTFKSSWLGPFTTPYSSIVSMFTSGNEL